MPGLEFLLQPEPLLVWTSVLKTVVIMGIVLTMVAYSVWAERKVSAFIQDRVGPNRVGWAGLIQPIADGVKLLLKENFVPAGVNKFYFSIAPSLAMVPAILVLAVLPFGSTLFGVPMVIADLNIGILWVFAVSSLGVYGIVLAGWASNSKYSLLGGIRGAAQMISYELSLGLSLIPIVMLADSFSIVEIVKAQERYPFILVQPFAFIIFMISAMAESKRIPFDLPEAENELGAGYHTEYSGIRFGLFFLGEYVHLQVLGALVAVLFLGGWRGPVLPAPLWLFIKIIFVSLIMIWIRGTLPRLRYDQLMALGWKVLIPAALLNIIVTGAITLM